MASHEPATVRDVFAIFPEHRRRDVLASASSTAAQDDQWRTEQAQLLALGRTYKSLIESLVV